MFEELVARVRYHIKKANFMGLKEIESTLLLGESADAIEELQGDNAALNGTVSNLIQQIEKLSKPRWIPVTERLPETGADVLVMFPHNMAVASRDMGEWVVNSGDGWCTDVNMSDDEKEPTHWMSLPTPPTAEEGET